jgi:transcription elongation factor Elf1
MARKLTISTDGTVFKSVRYVDCSHCGGHSLLAWDETNERYLAICESCKCFAELDTISNRRGTTE